MSKVSVLIPSRDERFLPQTVNDVLSHSAGDVEVIAVLDGYWPNPPLIENKHLITLHRGASLGMRSAINSAAGIAKGDFLMKCDAHCSFAEGWDEALKSECDLDWVVVPRRYRLDAEAWAISDSNPIDYHYLCNPQTSKDHALHGVPWRARQRERRDVEVDDEMSSQGSCWFMHTRYFLEGLGGESEFGYGTFTQEFQEIGLKTWLGGGQVKVNKRTWYAHLHKKGGRGYSLGRDEVKHGASYSANYWMLNLWEGRVHDFEWLIDKFWPVPTWEEGWNDLHQAG